MQMANRTKCSAPLISLSGKSKSKPQWRIVMINFDDWINGLRNIDKPDTSGCIWKGVYRDRWQMEQQLRGKTRPDCAALSNRQGSECNKGRWRSTESHPRCRALHPEQGRVLLQMQPTPNSTSRLFDFHCRLRRQSKSFQAYSFGLRMYHLFLSSGGIQIPGSSNCEILHPESM